MPIPRAAALEDWLIDLSVRINDVARKELAKPGAGDRVREGAFGAATVRADAAAEQVIIDAYTDAPVPLNLFSEEIGHVRTPGAEWTLIADPIDGTRNAVRRIPFHCTALAVGRESLSDVELGVVRDATTDDLFQARKGKGAFLNGDRLKVRPLDPKNIIIAAALDYEKELNIKWRPHVHFRDLGSSALELCYVATGGLDLFLSTKAYLRVVDVAASVLILREAGGHVLDLQKKPLNASYDLKERVSMVALGDPAAWKVLE